jgi:hypothetical protein
MNAPEDPEATAKAPRDVLFSLQATDATANPGFALSDVGVTEAFEDVRVSSAANAHCAAAW